jgi:hypothetical protein
MFLMGKRISSIVIVFSWKSTFVVHGLLTYYEVIHWRLVSQAILYNVRLKADLLTGRVLQKRDFNVTHPVCDKDAITIAPRLRDNALHNGNAFTGPFF